MEKTASLPSAVAPQLLATPQCVWPAGAQLGEGTCWSVREQALYWVDILGGLLHRWRPADGARQSWPFDETISAVAERTGGEGLIISLRKRLALFDLVSGALQTLAEPEAERPGNRFNDGKCDARGRFWAGTMDFACEAPTGALYFLEGRVCTLAFDAGFKVTNGPTWIDQGRTMLFNDTVGRSVYAMDFDAATAALGAPRLWLRFDAADGVPDGMTTDAAGRVWIAHWGAAAVTCHDPATAAELLRVPLPTAHITNVAFGGPDLRTLFITSARSGLSEAQCAEQPLAGGLFSVPTDAEGCPARLFDG